MKRYGNIVIGAAIAVFLIGLGPAVAQTTTFRNYHCADGSEFIVGFYPYDSRAYLQIDGGPVMLRKRLAISGTRYSGTGVTLRFDKAGHITVKRPGRPATACDVI